MTTAKDIIFGALMGAFLIWGLSGVGLTFAEMNGAYGPCTGAPEIMCLKVN